MHAGISALIVFMHTPAPVHTHTHRHTHTALARRHCLSGFVHRHQHSTSISTAPAQHQTQHTHCIPGFVHRHRLEGRQEAQLGHKTPLPLLQHKKLLVTKILNIS